MKIARYILRRIISATKSLAAVLKGSQASSLNANDTTERSLPKDASEMTAEDWAEEWIKFNEMWCNAPQ